VELRLVVNDEVRLMRQVDLPPIPRLDSPGI
jgi:hypothetical protein